MTCSHRSRTIALYVGGELGKAGTRRIEKHLRECASCRELADDLAADRATLGRLEARASDGLELGSIRSSVMAKVATRRPAAVKLVRSPRLAAAAVGFVAVAAVAALVANYGGRRVPLTDGAPSSDDRVVEVPPGIPDVEPEHSGEEAPEAPAAAEAVAGHEPRTRITRSDPPVGRPAPAPHPVANEPMLIKILTDDPEVVIYWIVEPKGAEEHV